MRVATNGLMGQKITTVLLIGTDNRLLTISTEVGTKHETSGCYFILRATKGRQQNCLAG